MRSAQKMNVNLLNELERIETELKEGKEVRREFWRVVGRIKRESVRDEEVLRKAAEIRDRIFGRRIIIGFWPGFLAFLFLFTLSNILLYTTATSPVSEGLKLAGIVVAELLTLYFTFLVGRCISALLAGIKVEGFYRYSPLEFGVKVDYLSYLKATQERRVLLYSGAIVLEHLVMLIHAVFLYGVGSYWIVPALLLLANLPFSYVIHRTANTGELHRLIRELRIMREIKANE
ncbi:hypothetical protein [Geoglobus ahangari]